MTQSIGPKRTATLPARIATRPTVLAAAALIALGMAPLAGLVLVGAVVVHAAKSPDRLAHLAFATAFCEVGVLVGR